MAFDFGIGKDWFSTQPADRYGYVFGTFPGAGVSYNAEEFERIRQDGISIIDLVPDCRVFVFGAEVTNDVISVSISNSFNGNSCQIKLANPRGKYEISKADLAGRWREDKDILATYSYERFQRQKPMRPDLLKMFLDKETFAKYKEAQRLFFSGAGSRRPTPSSVTRMAFETKFYSGIDKRVGDLVFDFRDPIHIFMKGRFSPYWYFAFSGVVSRWDSRDLAGEEQAIDLFGEDILFLLKRSKYVQHGSLLASASGSTITRNIHTTQRYSIYEDAAAGVGGIDQAIKKVIFGHTYEPNVHNCHPRSITGITFENSGDNEYDISKLRSTLEKNFKIGRSQIVNFETPSKSQSGYGFTLSYGTNPDATKLNVWSDNPQEYETASMFSAHPRFSNLIKISDINPNVQGGKLNSNPLGPTNDIYLQYNRIYLNSYENQKELNLRYLESIRYWEVQPKISETPNPDINTGWDDSQGYAIGVAGIHPALPSEFVDNFNILERVWLQCFEPAPPVLEKYEPATKKLDNMVVSPHDKIREVIFGNPTEASGGNEGSNRNLFRSRLFVVIPIRYSEKSRALTPTVLAALTIMNEQTSSTFDAVKKIVEAAEFNLFSSPMGDIFIEPPMYDYHPAQCLLGPDKNTDGKIDSKPIYLKKRPIEFRSLHAEVFAESKKIRNDYAYMFNPKANHPFFIMEKDKIRGTQSFLPENVKTEIKVIGSSTASGTGVSEGVQSPIVNGNNSILHTWRPSKGSGNKMEPGLYLANGLGSRLNIRDLMVEAFIIQNQIDYLERQYKREALLEIYQNNKNDSFEDFLYKAADAAITLTKKEFHTKKGWKQSIGSSIAAGVKEKKNGVDNDASENPYGLNNLERTQKIALEGLCPTILSELSKSKSINTPSDASRQANLGNTITALIKPSSQLKSWFEDISSLEQYSFFKRLGQESKSNQEKTLTKTGISPSLLTQIESDLINLYEAIALESSTQLSKSYFAIQSIKQAQATLGTEDIKIADNMTLGKLKVLEQAGIYDPRTDMIRRYGYNPGPTIKNLLISNGEEAYRYAVTKFNQLFGEAFRIRAEVIGRPEFMLNRPYYFEGKDCIALLDKFDLSFSTGSDFQSSIELTYVRKNSLTYNYTLGVLDELTGKPNNEYFYKAMDYFLKSMSEMNQKVSNWVNKSFSRAGGDVARNIGSALGEKDEDGLARAETFGQNFFQLKGAGFAGGVYSAHDFIGHMDYDSLGKLDNISDKNKDTSTQDPKSANSSSKTSGDSEKSAIIARVKDVCLRIRNELDQLVEIEIQIDLKTDEMKNKTKELETLGAKLGGDTESSDKEVAKLYTKLKSIKSDLDSAKALIKNLKLKHANKCLLIYGNKGSYSAGAYNSKKSGGQRQPTETDLKNAQTLRSKNKNSQCLYVKLINELERTSNIKAKDVELIDDRLVGWKGTGYQSSFVHKIGYNTKVPAYYINKTKKS